MSELAIYRRIAGAYCTAYYSGQYPTDWVDVEEIQRAVVVKR